MQHHPLTRTNGGPGTRALSTPVPPAWPSYKGSSQFVGTSPSGKVTVFVDASLGAPALQNAHDLVADADRIVNENDRIFGTTGGHTDVLVFALEGYTDGTGGADHWGCDYTSGAAIEVDAAFGNSAIVSALFEAELSECSMGGNLCGRNTGEALSRLCAAVVGGNVLPAVFVTAPAWVQAGMPDFVNQYDDSDTNEISTGCGMAFLSWLVSKGYRPETIAPAMVAIGDGGTFAQLYAKLTSDTAANAFPAFVAAVQALPGGVTNDDPFGAEKLPAHLAALTPATFELAGRIFGSILADVAAGRAEDQILGGVRALLAAGGAARSAAPSNACIPRSHRLKPPGR